MQRWDDQEYIQATGCVLDGTSFGESLIDKAHSIIGVV